MEVARAVFTSRVFAASLTVARKSGSRMVSTTGCCRRAPCGTRRFTGWLAHCTRPSALTAMTASCMLLSRVSSWRWLERTAAKPCSTWRAVLSMAPATRPISSREGSLMRAWRSPSAMRAATSTMRSRRRALQCAAAAATMSANRNANPEASDSLWRTCAATASTSESG